MREVGADVQAGFYYLAYGFFIRIGYMVFGLNELDRFAVTYYVSFETIFLAATAVSGNNSWLLQAHRPSRYNCSSHLSDVLSGQLF